MKIIPFAILLAVCLACAKAPVKSDAPQLQILSTTSNVEYGVLTVEGEVKNISSDTIRVSPVVSVYDSKGNLITSADGEATFENMLPNGKSPFKFMVEVPNKKCTFQIEFQGRDGKRIVSK